MYGITTATTKIEKMSKRLRVIQGGTSASKTVSILIYLISLSQQDKTPTLTSVVSESFPHLRRGAERDFLNILKEHQYYKDNLWDKTNHIYTFETGSKIEFFSVDQAEKVRGARRDRLFINECNNVKFSAFEELEVRTKDFIFLDYNPTQEFWLFTEVEPKRTDWEKIILTYKDNEALSKEIIASIEQRRNRADWWKVYGLGELGELEGKIYKDWNIIPEIPHEARLEVYGLDYGYTNDPTAIVAIYKYNGAYIWDEIAYQKGLSNKEIAEILKNCPQAVVVPDSAEPKSNDELKTYGLTVIPAEKGKDSVRHGIDLVKAQRISVTQRSINIIKEYRNYLWEVDKDGKVLNIPEHEFSHSMDAIRYGLSFILKSPKIELKQFKQQFSTREDNSNR
jgi:phage terminase large subunit